MESGEELTRLIAQGEGWDVAEEHRALAHVRAELFTEQFRPISLSRYVLLKPLGSGGGGIVYRAYDPDLNREVAVKVVRTGEEAAETDARERLLREAQAIARLNHPNVVTVYDVGRLDDEATNVFGAGVFVVMELIEGVDLREWLQRGRRRQKILDVFSAAGRGLACAHEHAIVHRDFKPANVLLGNDGRVRVLDFGLARTFLAATDDSRPAGSTPAAPAVDLESSPSASPSLLDHDLTQAGTILGTPAYMAPEQHEGSPADALSDQYAFCVALYEALHGQRPFPSHAVDELRDAKLRGPPRPANSSVPRWLDEVLARGLQADPAKRWPTMDALLAALARKRFRRMRAAAVGVAIAALIGGLGYSAASLRSPASSLCDDDAGQLDGVWDSTIRDSAQASFGASDIAHAGAAWKNVEAAVDRYVAAWTEARARTCAPENSPEAAAPEETALRLLCLERKRLELSEVTRLLASADEQVIRSAAHLVGKLPDPGQCDKAAHDLPHRLMLEGASREELRELDGLVLRAGALVRAGKYDDASTLLDSARGRADELADERAKARSLGMLGDIAFRTGDFELSKQRYAAAFVSAERSSSAPLAIESLLGRSRAETELGHYDAADNTLEIAAAKIEAMPSDVRMPLLDGQLAQARGHLYVRRERGSDAVEQLRYALAVYRAELGATHPDVGKITNKLGAAELSLGRLSAALERFQAARELYESAFGAGHPFLGALHNNIGHVMSRAGRLVDARAELESALRLKTEAYGAGSPNLVSTLTALGDALEGLREFDRALQHYQRALDLERETHGEDGKLIPSLLSRIGRVLRRQGRCSDAAPSFERAKRMLATRDQRAWRSSVVALHLDIGRCFVATGDARRGLAEFEQARSLLAEDGDEDNPDLAPVLLAMATAKLSVQETGPATSLLETALRSCTGREDMQSTCTAVRFVLAEALRDQQPQRTKQLMDLVEEFVNANGWSPEGVTLPSEKTKPGPP